MKKLAGLTSAILVLALAAPEGRQSQPGGLLTLPLDSYLEALRQQAGIPGLSAAVVFEGRIIWERGFGFQNVESRIRATPDTPYDVGDLSQLVAGVLLLQCVEQRHLDLNEPLRTYGLAYPEAGVTLRHVLTHTSAGVPGETFRYSPERFAQLSPAIEWCAPQPYRKSVAHRVLERLAMRDSVPGRDLQNPEVVADGLFEPAALERYARVLERTAVPYIVDRRGRPTRTEVPVEGINAAAGLISTVRDLARFDAALDAPLLLREETLALAWTNAMSNSGTVLPTGLGWFVQSYRGQPVVWHFGYVPNAYSSLVVRLPARRLTFIVLANSDGLNAPFSLSAGDVTRSLFATLFLRLFA